MPPSLDAALIGLFSNSPWAIAVIWFLSKFGKWLGDNVWPQYKADWELSRTMKQEEVKELTGIKSALNEQNIKMQLLIRVLDDIRRVSAPNLPAIYSEFENPGERHGDPRKAGD